MTWLSDLWFVTWDFYNSENESAYVERQKRDLFRLKLDGMLWKVNNDVSASASLWKTAAAKRTFNWDRIAVFTPFGCPTRETNSDLWSSPSSLPSIRSNASRSADQRTAPASPSAFACTRMCLTRVCKALVRPERSSVAEGRDIRFANGGTAEKRPYDRWQSQFLQLHSTLFHLIVLRHVCS